jgi:hypothetical protein
LILEDHELTFMILQELLTSGLECVLLLLERIFVNLALRANFLTP